MLCLLWHIWASNSVVLLDERFPYPSFHRLSRWRFIRSKMESIHIQKENPLSPAWIGKQAYYKLPHTHTHTHTNYTHSLLHTETWISHMNTNTHTHSNIHRHPCSHEQVEFLSFFNKFRFVCGGQKWNTTRQPWPVKAEPELLPVSWRRHNRATHLAKLCPGHQILGTSSGILICWCRETLSS